MGVYDVDADQCSGQSGTGQSTGYESASAAKSTEADTWLT
jgi:hypothetical protein